MKTTRPRGRGASNGVFRRSVEEAVEGHQAVA